jgi:4-amino-4-deoxy-L-arabinose transferase-like glycosyltransferase
MKRYYVAIIIILMMAVYLRLSDLDHMIFTTDEIAQVRSAKEYLNGNFIYNFYVFDQPPLMRYFFTLQIALFGASEISIRIVSVIFSLLTCVLSYLFVKKFYKSTKMAIMVLIFTSFSIINIENSRMALYESTLGFFFLLAIYLFAEKIVNNKWNTVMLGISLGLGMATKYMMLYLIIAIILYSIAKKYIGISLNPRISISIEKGLSKTILISIIVFLLVFPQALYPMQADFNIKVQNRSKEFMLNLPTLILSMGNVGSSAISGYGFGPLAIPFAYFMFFFIKENILFIFLFFVSLFFIYKNPRELDKFLIFTLLIFLIFLWFQKWGYSSNYILVVIPIISIIAARFVLSLSDKIVSAFIILSFFILFLFAFMIHPYYDLYYGSLNDVLEIPQNHYTDGFKEGIAYIEENCNTLYTREGYADVMYTYMNKTKIILSPELPSCVMTESKDQDYVAEFVRTHDCEMIKKIVIRGISLLNIYYCKP